MAPREAGPVVWLSVILATCLLLLALRAVLWLVVPGLLALIIYYGLRPAYKRLLLAGVAQTLAASVLTAGFLLAAGALVLLAAPWLGAHAVSWQDAAVRYVEGGLIWLERSFAYLESQFALLRRIGLSQGLAARITTFADELVREHAPQFFLGLGTWIPALLLAPFLAFFFLRDGYAFQQLIGRAVPNAFFERTLYLLHELDRTAHSYFRGLFRLTVLDTLTLGVGLWALGISNPLGLGLLTAVLAWVPYVGSIAGCVIVVLVAATDFPQDASVAYGAIALFILARLLDDFVYMPMTIGRSLNVHPIVSVLMLFAGGAIAGVPGLMLVLPLLGVVRVIGETVGVIVTDPRLRARHVHARQLRRVEASHDLRASE